MGQKASLAVKSPYYRGGGPLYVYVALSSASSYQEYWISLQICIPSATEKNGSVSYEYVPEGHISGYIRVNDRGLKADQCYRATLHCINCGVLTDRLASADFRVMDRPITSSSRTDMSPRRASVEVASNETPISTSSSYLSSSNSSLSQPKSVVPFSSDLYRSVLPALYDTPYVFHGSDPSSAPNKGASSLTSSSSSASLSQIKPAVHKAASVPSVRGIASRKAPPKILLKKSSSAKPSPVSDNERRLLKENAELKRELEKARKRLRAYNDVPNDAKRRRVTTNVSDEVQTRKTIWAAQPSHSQLSPSQYDGDDEDDVEPGSTSVPSLAQIPIPSAPPSSLSLTSSVPLLLPSSINSTASTEPVTSYLPPAFSPSSWDCATNPEPA